jgi:hypothetical protein
MAFDVDKAAEQIIGYLKLTRAHYLANGRLDPSPTLQLRREIAECMPYDVFLLAEKIKDGLTPYNGWEL